MRIIIRGRKPDRVLEGAAWGALSSLADAVVRGRDPWLALAAGIVAGGAAQAHHRLADRAAASVQYTRWANRALDVIEPLTKSAQAPAHPSLFSVQRRSILPR